MQVNININSTLVLHSEHVTLHSFTRMTPLIQKVAIKFSALPLVRLKTCKIITLMFLAW